MSDPTLLPDPQLVVLEHLTSDADALQVVVTVRRETVPCPDCQQPAQRVHSRYHRTLADQPWNGVRVRLHLRTRRWFCDQSDCPRRIFTERLPGLVQRYARRTEGQARVLRLLAYVLGGEAGARTAAELGVPASPDTLRRQLRHRAAFLGRAPRVLGVDDSLSSGVTVTARSWWIWKPAPRSTCCRTALPRRWRPGCESIPARR